MVDPISWALEQARRDLIDLTRRNRLLHAPLEGKRPWCLAVSGQSPDDLFAKLYKQENFRGYPPIVADDELIDHRIDISKCIHIVDADSSQAVVIEEVSSGRNLVVQGPPGTGKSQTITNVIAAAAHSGKTVLFVAEKTAALEVVHDRLRKAGLEALCLEIHSRKANKRTVVKSLEQALQFSNVSLSGDEIGTKLAARRDKLNRWSNALHKPVANSGQTGFEIIGRQVKLRADGVRLLDQSLDDAANWDATKIASVEVALDRAATAVRNLGVAPNGHIWFGTNLDTQSPFDLQRLIPLINAAIDRIGALEKETLKIIAAMKGIDEPSLGDALAAIKSLRHVAAVPKHARHILASATWVQNLDRVEREIEEGERLSQIVLEAEEHFSPEAWIADSANLLLVLRADGRSLFRRLGRRFRRANAELCAICRNKPPKDLNKRIALIELLQNAQKSSRQLIDRSGFLAEALGSTWAEHRTKWQEVRALSAWVRVAIQQVGGVRLVTFAARSKDLHPYSAFAEKLETSVRAARPAIEAVQNLIRANVPSVFDASPRQ